VWADADAYLDPVLGTMGALWPPGQTAETAEIWPMGEVWPESEVWPDSTAWRPSYTSPLTNGPVPTEALSSGFRD
jgi:hypothetical protein